MAFNKVSQFDDAYLATKTVSAMHAAVHAGVAFHATVSDAEVADDGLILIELITPETGEIHLKAMSLWLNDQPWLLEIIEDPTLTTGTEEISAVNRNRGSEDEPTAVLKSDPTEISGGTVIQSVILGGGSGIASQVFSENIALEIEWVLAADTTYLIRLTNQSGGTQAASIMLDWYELP